MTVFMGLLTMRISLLFSVLLLSASLMAQDFVPYSLTVPGVEREIVMIPVKGGEFNMGSPESEEGRKTDEGPQHKVSVSDFWMAEMEITWEQYEAFVYASDLNISYVDKSRLDALGIDGVSSATTPYAEMSFGMGKEGYPAVNMTQYAALMFCKWLSAITGEFYRLPTEAEWEYACKAGRDNKYSFGDDSAMLQDYAIFNAEKYEKAGSKKPSELGFFDLNGNVAEWTMDQYDPEYYTTSDKRDPWNEPELLYPRTTRGGSWKSSPEELRCSARMPSNSRWKFRDPQLPKSRWWHTNAPFVGFRIVRPAAQLNRKEIEKFWLEAMEDYGQ